MANIIFRGSQHNDQLKVDLIYGKGLLCIIEVIMDKVKNGPLKCDFEMQ
jgi:hypothetical protein